MYWASMVEIEIIRYFLLQHDTIVLLMEKQYPITNFQYLGSPE